MSIKDTIKSDHARTGLEYGAQCLGWYEADSGKY